MNQADAARAFHTLHARGFLLPNVWDAASARIFEAAGFAAVGTTSAGIAHARGHQDRQTLTREQMCREVRTIIEATWLPVNADIEAGYGDVPADVARSAADFVAAGAVGLNLEDATGRPRSPLYSLEEQVRRVGAAREAIERSGMPVFLNARTDTYLIGVGRDEPERLAETLVRGEAYLQAGADGIFVPLATEVATVGTLARELRAPLNVMAFPGSPSAPELLAAGASRVSLGQSVMLAALGLTARIAAEFYETGRSGAMNDHFYGFAEAQALFAERR